MASPDDDAGIRMSWLPYAIWILLLVMLIVLITLLILGWRERFPTITVITGASGSSGSSGGSGSSGASGFFIFTGPTGPAGFSANTGATGIQGPTGETGASGYFVPVDQIGVLNPSTIAIIESTSTDRFGLAVTEDQRTDMSTPTGIQGVQTNHKDVWDPFAVRWWDYGPWLGSSQVTGPTGAAAITGPTGPTGVAVTGPTGFGLVTGPTGQDGSSLYFQTGFLYGSAVDGNFTAGNFAPIRLLRDQFYNNLWVAPNGRINTNGYRIFVAGNLQLDGLIENNGLNGSNATGLQFSGQTNPGGTGGAANVLAGGASGGFGIVLCCAAATKRQPETLFVRPGLNIPGSRRWE